MRVTLGWSPGVSDPTPVGWLTVAAYFSTAIVCLVAAWRSSGNEPKNCGSDRLYWIIIAALFMLLSVNKQLDIQTLMTELAREWAKADGWYSQRRYYQKLFLLGLACLLAMVLSAAAHIVRQRPLPLRAALLGLTLTCSFVLMRAASFHHIDRWLGQSVSGLRWNWMLELGGIGTVAAAASVAALSARGKQ